ncbi:MAG: FIVAR domain-containing protein, partial [Erysipelotrichaceae bacterium]|nr:FIVAR domain-containing protein [Erysipelotrichaceae bacterium]
MKFYKKLLAFVFALTFALSSVTSVNAATYDFDAPTSPMSVDDNIITASVHRAASVLPEILGLNTVSGFSMINGTMPTSLEEAKTKLMLGAFGTNMNQSPDPYYYNYFYNFYAEANGLATSEDAVIIPENNAAASPVAADTTIVDAYGTSISLAGRPDILIGVSASNSGTDLTGYDALISDIRTGAIGEDYYQEGDEDYDPYLVGYTTTTTYDMVKILNEVAEIMDEIYDETGMTGRYNTDGSSATEISKAFADYVAGIPTYVLSQISKLKTIAILTAVNDDGTYTVAGSAAQSATSSNRIVEYCALITDNLNDSTEDTSMNASKLKDADVIIYNGMSSANLDALKDAIDVAGGDSDSMIFITDIPDTVYGMTMNSIENGMGFAYYAGCIYGNELGTTPAELCAYFYEQFYHVNSGNLQEVVSATFADVDQPYSTSLENYNTSDVQSWINTGRQYYVAHYGQFSSTALTYVWASDGTTSIDKGSSKTYTEVDTTELEDLVSNVKTTENDSTYTEESYSALQEAIDAANEVLNNPESNQAEINAALANLQSAYDAL